MSVHVDEIHSEVSTGASAGANSSATAAAVVAGEPLGRDLTAWRTRRVLSGSLESRLSAEGFDD